MALKVGIIGFGYAAQTFHFPLLSHAANYDLCAVLSSQAKPPVGDAQHYTELEDFLKHPSLDVVIITAPNSLHYSLSSEVLQRGLHLVVEKPMTVTLAQAQHLYALAAANACTLTVFHNRRWDGDFLTLRAALDHNRLGAVKLFESRFDRFRPRVRDRWRENAGAGAGIWFDLGPHLVDQALQLFGWPIQITARLQAQRQGAQSVDYFHVQLHYPDCEVVLHSSPHCAGPVQRFRVEGSAGTLTIADLDPQEAQLKAGLSLDDPQFGVSQRPRARLDTASGTESPALEHGNYPAFYQQLARALTAEGPLPVTQRDALSVMALLALAEQSQQRGMTLDCPELSEIV